MEFDAANANDAGSVGDVESDAGNASDAQDNADDTEVCEEWRTTSNKQKIAFLGNFGTNIWPKLRL